MGCYSNDHNKILGITQDNQRGDHKIIEFNKETGTITIGSKAKAGVKGNGEHTQKHCMMYSPFSPLPPGNKAWHRQETGNKT